MTHVVVQNPTDLAIVLSKVCARILTNIFYSISNDILQMKGEYEVLSTQFEKRCLFVDYSIRSMRTFYFHNFCLLLKPTLFSHLYENFEVNTDYSGENLKIINKSYLGHCIKKFK